MQLVARELRLRVQDLARELTAQDQCMLDLNSTASAEIHIKGLPTNYGGCPDMDSRK